MDPAMEKRSTKRFAQTARVVIQMHCRAGWHGSGELIDSSRGGVGLCAPEAFRKGTIVVLRVNGQGLDAAPCWHREAGPFNLVTARVRWCRELQAPSEASVFRIGLQRLLPCY